MAAMPRLTISSAYPDLTLRRAAEPPPTWRHLVPAGLFLLVSVVTLLIMAVQPRPGQQRLAVVLAPWQGALQAQLVAGRAHARLVDAGGLPNVFIMTGARPDLAAALYRAGAWLVVDPLSAHGCLSTVPNAQGSRHG